MKRMNSLLIILAIGLLAVVAQAGSKFMNYQGVLKNGNEPVTTATEFIFEIYETEIAVSNMWSETLIVTPKANGKFHIKLGKITPFGDTVFTGNERWLGVTISGVPLNERTELGSVPFANLAHNVPDTTIGSDKIKKHAIVDSLIGLKEIGLDKIKNNAIVDSLIKNKEIGFEKIKNNAIVDSLIKNKAIGHEKIKNDAIVDSLIKDGTIKFVDIGQNGAEGGDVMKWSTAVNGWVPAADQYGSNDNDWDYINGALFTSGEWGIARRGSTLKGLVWQTHVNLGVDGVTGDITKEYIYCTVSGGLENSALDRSSTVGGGEANLAAGKYSNVPGGFGNTAYGDNSFAAGTLAKAQHSGSIVISANNARGTEIDLLDSVWTDRGEQMVFASR